MVNYFIIEDKRTGHIIDIVGFEEDEENTIESLKNLLSNEFEKAKHIGYSNEFIDQMRER